MRPAGARMLGVAVVEEGQVIGHAGTVLLGRSLRLASNQASLLPRASTRRDGSRVGSTLGDRGIGGAGHRPSLAQLLGVLAEGARERMMLGGLVVKLVYEASLAELEA